MSVNVLVVDDSPTARQLMTHLIDSADDLQVVGQAHDGRQAVQMTHKLKPDVVLMDIIMPDMTGLEATREIMSTTPTPIVMISAGLDGKETDVAFKAIKMGALAVLKKPVAPTHPDFAKDVARLITTVRSMASVRVIHHWKKSDEPQTQPAEPANSAQPAQSPDIIAIASSTGGPAALNEIFSRLPANFSVPIAVVQHISPEFLPSLVSWLDTITPLAVRIATAGDRPQAGHIYFAPGDAHLTLTARRTFELDTTTRASYTPSADILLSSVALNYRQRAIGIVLTGMGNDGADGLQRMANAGAYTITQDEATSVVYGMPQAARPAAQAVLPIQSIAEAIMPIQQP